MITLYRHPQSLYCANVKMFLEEIRVSYQVKDLDLATGEHLQSQYTKMNPTARVPFLEAGQFSLSESNAIVRYLASRHLAFHWYPYNLEDRAQVEQWMDYIATHCNKPLGEYIWYKVFAARYNLPAAPSDVQRVEKKLARELPLIEKHLIGRSFLVDAIPTLADLVLTPFLAVAVDKANLSLSSYGRLDKWLQQMTARPSFQAIKTEIY